MKVWCLVLVAVGLLSCDDISDVSPSRVQDCIRFCGSLEMESVIGVKISLGDANMDRCMCVPRNYSGVIPVELETVETETIHTTGNGGNR